MFRVNALCSLGGQSHTALSVVLGSDILLCERVARLGVWGLVMYVILNGGRDKNNGVVCTLPCKKRVS